MYPTPLNLSANTLAKLAGLFAGLVFGLYWIFLRRLDSHGIAGIWAVVIFNWVPFSLLLPLLLLRWRAFIPGRGRFHVCAVLSGLAYVLYACAFLYTHVVKVIVLFYLMPIWGFLLARLFIGAAITNIRWLCMGLGVAGMLVIFGTQPGFVLPTNLGDWMALSAGLVWAGASLLLLTDRQDTINYTLGFLCWASVISLIAAGLATHHGVVAPLELGRLPSVLVWMLPVAAFVVLPASLATIYAPSRLNPGLVGLLFMTEISVASVSAALLSGEPFGYRELSGVILISLAGLGEPLHDWLRG